MSRRRQRRRKCRHCKTFFVPDYRNAPHQHYCSKPACRQASKKASQRRWAHRPKGRGYFRGPAHLQRVQAWRQAHPGYWKKQSPLSNIPQAPAAQALNPEQRSCNVPRVLPRPLQDFCLTEDPAFVGLISMVTGSTLQDDIATTARKLQLRGQNILGVSLPECTATQLEFHAYDQQTSDPAGALAPHPAGVQLGGPSAGPP